MYFVAAIKKKISQLKHRKKNNKKKKRQSIKLCMNL